MGLGEKNRGRGTLFIAPLDVSTDQKPRTGKVGWFLVCCSDKLFEFAELLTGRILAVFSTIPKNLSSGPLNLPVS